MEARQLQDESEHCTYVVRQSMGMADGDTTLQGYKHSPITSRDMALVSSPAKEIAKLSITTGLQYPKVVLALHGHSLYYVAEMQFGYLTSRVTSVPRLTRTVPHAL